MNKIYFILGLFLYFISFLVESYFLNIVAVLFFLSYTIFLLKRDKNFSAIALFFVWSYFITATICCIAEFGGYFAEIQEVSYLTGATARNTTLIFFTIYFTRLSFLFFSKALPIININMGLSSLPNKIIEIIYLGMIITLFFIWVKYGHPNDYGLDRFLYWSGIAPTWGRWLQNISILFILYFGYMYASTKHTYYIIIVLLGNITYYLVGEKFTIFVMSFFYFIIPILLLSNKSIIKILFNKKTLFILFSFLIIMIITIYLSYFYISSGDAEQATSRFLLRILLQAQMWWKIDLLSLNKGIEELDTIITGFIGINAEATETGMYFFMKQVAPSGLYNMMVENGITFTMLYPANLNYFFSFLIAPIVTIPIGFYAGFVFGIILKLINSKSSLLLIIAAILYQNIASIILMGQTFHLFSVRNLLAFVIIFFYLLLSVGYSSRR